MTMPDNDLKEMFSLLVPSHIHKTSECDEQYLYILFSKKLHFWFREVFSSGGAEHQKLKSVSSVC